MVDANMAILAVSALLVIYIVYKYSDSFWGGPNSLPSDKSRAAWPNVRMHAKDGMVGNAGYYNQPWNYAFAKTGYPLASGTNKDGMTPCPGYYAGNLKS